MYRPTPGQRGWSRPQGRGASWRSDDRGSGTASEPGPGGAGHGIGEALNGKHRRRVLTLPPGPRPQDPARDADAAGLDRLDSQLVLEVAAASAADSGVGGVAVGLCGQRLRQGGRLAARSGSGRRGPAARPELPSRAPARGGAAATRPIRPAAARPRPSPGAPRSARRRRPRTGRRSRWGRRRRGVAGLPAALLRGRDAAARRGARARSSSTVPFEQMGQSAMKRLWRQKSDTPGPG